MQYVVQHREGGEWKPVIQAGLPLVLFEGQPIPPDAQREEMRCIPVHETEAY